MNTAERVPDTTTFGGASAASAIHRFRLYVAGDAQNAAVALANLTAFCHKHLVGRHAIEVVDVLKHPLLALEERIYMTPTLVVLSPLPVRRIVGTLGDGRALQLMLGVATEGP